MVSFSLSLSEEAENWLLSAGGEWVSGYWNSPAIAPLTVYRIVRIISTCIYIRIWVLIFVWGILIIIGSYRHSKRMLPGNQILLFVWVLVFDGYL